MKYLSVLLGLLSATKASAAYILKVSLSSWSLCHPSALSTQFFHVIIISKKILTNKVFHTMELVLSWL